ncbi:MAG: hypothetical protein CVV42_15235 [Candidatus Riflebacteria bacterium HGW-Riflebacteria-2]|nr:MAG: hypothetical protein CVV42_15235 [Candidatus Riflebacteria bacterium HGW-Riflebacteria-2]
MSNGFLSIDWGGSELKGIYTGNRREFSLSAGNIRLLDQNRVQQICRDITQVAEVGKDQAVWLIGAAGADDIAAAQRLKEAVKEAHPTCLEVVVKSDYECNHAACLAGKDGILSVNGTGSVIFAKCGQKSARFGGWGYVLDELPSGAWFGRQALAGVLRNLEGFSDSRICREIFASRYGSADRRSIIDGLYRSASAQKKLGEYAEVLTEAYAADCPFATKAISDSIAQLLGFFQQAAAQTGMSGTISLCGSGGLWQKWPEMTSLVFKKANDAGLALNLVKPSSPLSFGPLVLQAQTDFVALQTLQTSGPLHATEAC